MSRVALVLVLLVGAASLGRCTAPIPNPETILERVIVTDTLIVESEPQVEIRWRDRIVYRTIEPTQVAEAPTGGMADLQAFCAPSAALPGPDSVPPPPRAVLLRSIDTDPSWWWSAQEVRVVGVTSSGGLQRTAFQAPVGWTLRMDGDAAVVRGPRFNWRGFAEFALPLVAGYAVGTVLAR